MQKCIADKHGGTHVELTTEEEALVLSDWGRGREKQERAQIIESVKARIPKADDLALLTAKAQFAPDEADRVAARKTILEAMRAENELKALSS